MAAEPLKFRCDRCGQLLGVSPAKAGRPVKCPKCGAGLVVPGLPPQPLVDDPGDRKLLQAEERPAPSREEWPEAEVGTPGFFDVIDLEQEELKSLFEMDSGEHPTIAPAGSIVSKEAEPIPPGFLDLSPRGSPRNRNKPEEVGPVLDLQPDQGLIDREASGGPRRSRDLPGRIEPTSVAVRPRSGRDVVMPRLAFVSWSLFVLLALFLAFVSGLLVGRFVWTGPI
jgi:DNA-directed RNA polymerase subunit RPC12/RpoP